MIKLAEMFNQMQVYSNPGATAFKKEAVVKVSTNEDMSDSEIKKTPRTDLLTEVELEAFNGWYASCRKPEFGMNHEEATLKSWKLLIESMQILYKERGDRYKP